MRRALLALPPTVLIVVILWFGFGKDPSNTPDPLVGRTAPSFALKTTSGQTVRLSALRGRPVVVSFFASWCTSCQAEEPDLVQVYRRWRGKVNFVGVIFQEDAKTATAFTRENGGRWPDLIDPAGNTALNYGVTGLPSTFFINRKGRVTGYTVSLATQTLNQEISSAMRA